MAAGNQRFFQQTTGPLGAISLAAQLGQPSVDSGARSTILVLDQVDVNRRLLQGMLRAEDYRILEARRPQEALALLKSEKVDLVILDLMMPGMGGPEFCRIVKADRRMQFVPILMLTSVQGVENEVAGIDSGADEFLTRPLHATVVRTRIRAMLRNKAAIDSLEEAEAILFALAQAIEHRDKYTGGHCERLAWYSVSLGMALGLPRRQLLALHRGGFLHDIGKVAVPDAILFKPGRLDEHEWTLMRAHTVKGEEICQPMKSLSSVLPVIRSHHERWDGSGYPDGLRGEQIPLVARILQVADIYDALTTVRPYKSAFSPAEALGMLDDEVARGWRDAELVGIFKQLHKSGLSEAYNPMLLDWQQLELMGQSVSGPVPLPAD
jgi:putative two-component system response regulator